ncbi:50S ribosomal protein L29 [Candidatus Uhrbacteria bacterium RIFCSPLOWO2_12_FULL_46_10]|uniref:Large ribosomal subunit protein uL29 n=1 Tax=Candidatus Uhrbacteria bacterium RIFCSPLOWO2_01_FULL_47_25 TaxID=1802402 RepID=A0A1F7UWY0_9BACT|nr:MAG: 50S ribosomal protein L29 [Parcubacteria group bacterium GW2011_GWA2_46_9]OGL59135.1 MAG: 50S ribosomal protein L29 [Candidatus Uhrbacteria bacterium RIFCSPHIGHO2_01_FULL_46_23]OGL70263.1 MAG: 50S ribosomal protein L29 [Candidatus Uhrbacteria bacterium RIFCSPHIGHO2_02_FULL_47_29]OGL74684.1 MAG: 50S ribosomal protein L29 [Candidatus Uhrbacteria bacterium RIFCSPHIGHO2_12_FULL_46_13]OGL82800.1 MAG: 50S ribosomal protein L29 [Candidatus Uhrbacteria bacterium RIFCSPLOWO2_01_FULL_47_25]OGL83
MVSIKEFRQKSDQELRAFLKDTRFALAESSTKAALKQLKDVKIIRRLKRDIARSLTILRERQ